jgi:hypothetical protein
MKIEREILYSIVMKNGAKIEVSEAELRELFTELKQFFEPIIPGGKYLHVGNMSISQPSHIVTKQKESIKVG